MPKENCIVFSGQLLVRGKVKMTVRELERAVREELIVKGEGNVAKLLVKVRNFLKKVADSSREGEKIVDSETMMELL